MKIKIDLQPLIKLENGLNNLPKSIADEYGENARNIFSKKVYVGTEDVSDESSSIVARGFTMPFEEYGAGILAISDTVGDVVVGEDTWSVEHKQQYHKWGYWVHNGQTYYYVMPKYAMHDTVTKLRSEAGRWAERYFNQ